MDDFMKYLDEILRDGVSDAKNALLNERERIWSSCALEYAELAKQIGDKDELVKAFSLIINELLLVQMNTLLLAVDGGEWISEKYRMDIVDKESATAINENVALHEEFMGYLWEERDGDPYRNL